MDPALFLHISASEYTQTSHVQEIYVRPLSVDYHAEVFSVLFAKRDKAMLYRQLLLPWPGSLWEGNLTFPYYEEVRDKCSLGTYTCVYCWKGEQLRKCFMLSLSPMEPQNPTLPAIVWKPCFFG